MDVIDGIKLVLRNTLQLGDRVEQFNTSTLLFGTLPELDSMAVVSVIAALEQQFQIQIDDEEITAETFETVGSLSRLVERKLAA